MRSTTVLARTSVALLASLSLAGGSACSSAPTSSTAANPASGTTAGTAAPAATSGTASPGTQGGGTIPPRGRSLGTTDVPIGFHPTSATDLDKADAVQGNTVEGAEPILESGFRAGRESRWTNGSDTAVARVFGDSDAKAALDAQAAAMAAAEAGMGNSGEKAE